MRQGVHSMDHAISRAAKNFVRNMVALFQSNLTEWYRLSDMRIVVSRPQAEGKF